MTTWTDVSDSSTTYGNSSGLDNNYVALDYVLDDYILAESVWTDSTSQTTSYQTESQASSTWTVVAQVTTTWA